VCVFVIFRQNYTLRYRVSDGVYFNATTVFINLTPSNMRLPVFSETEYYVTDKVEKDQSAVGHLLTTVWSLCLICYCYSFHI